MKATLITFALSTSLLYGMFDELSLALMFSIPFTTCVVVCVKLDEKLNIIERLGL